MRSDNCQAPLLFYFGCNRCRRVTVNLFNLMHFKHSPNLLCRLSTHGDYLIVSAPGLIRSFWGIFVIFLGNSRLSYTYTVFHE